MIYSQEYLDFSPDFMLNSIVQELMTGEVDSQIDYCNDSAARSMLQDLFPEFSGMYLMQFGGWLYADSEREISMPFSSQGRATAIAYILVKQELI